MEEISSINARIFTDAIRVVGQRTKTKLEPRNVVDAQFSAYYSMAVLALAGKGLLGEFSEERIKDPKVIDLAKKIKIEADSNLDRKHPKHFPAKVKVTLEDGREYEKRSKGNTVDQK